MSSLLSEISQTEKQIQRLEELGLKNWRWMGSGGFGVVYRVTADRLVQNQSPESGFSMIFDIACKVTEVKLLIEIDETVKSLLEESDSLNHLIHSNITTNAFIYYMLDKMSEFQTLIIFRFMNLCAGNLSSMIDSQTDQKMTENMAREWFEQISNALKYLHDNNVFHLAIKPNNILYSDESNKTIFQLSDMGILNTLNKWGTDRLGQSLYTPPEFIDNIDIDYLSADIFGLGITLAESVSGLNKPDVPQSNLQFLDFLIAAHNWNQKIESEKHISKNFADLIKGMTNTTASQRWSIDKILGCEWLTSPGKSSQPTTKRAENNALPESELSSEIIVKQLEPDSKTNNMLSKLSHIDFGTQVKNKLEENQIKFESNIKTDSTSPQVLVGSDNETIEEIPQTVLETSSKPLQINDSNTKPLTQSNEKQISSIITIMDLIISYNQNKIQPKIPLVNDNQQVEALKILSSDIKDVTNTFSGMNQNREKLVQIENMGINIDKDLIEMLDKVQNDIELRFIEWSEVSNNRNLFIQYNKRVDREQIVAYIDSAVNQLKIKFPFFDDLRSYPSGLTPDIEDIFRDYLTPIPTTDNYRIWIKEEEKRVEEYKRIKKEKSQTDQTQIAQQIEKSVQRIEKLNKLSTFRGRLVLIIELLDLTNTLVEMKTNGSLARRFPQKFIDKLFVKYRELIGIIYVWLHSLDALH